jgi:uncharacterized protein YpuA (DUF1002 family)
MTQPQQPTRAQLIQLVELAAKKIRKQEREIRKLREESSKKVSTNENDEAVQSCLSASAMQNTYLSSLRTMYEEDLTLIKQSLKNLEDKLAK